MSHPNKSVIIVGAGLSGLVAARTLSAHHVDLQIFEAQDRIGGRIVDFESACGHRFSLGGDWFGSGETRFNQLLTDLKLEKEPVVSQGRLIARLMEQTYTFSEEESKWLSPIVVPAELVSTELEDAFDRLKTLSQQVSTATPYLNSSEWDRLTLAEWSQQHIKDARQRKIFEIVVREETGRELYETSLLYYLYVYQSSVKRLEDDHVVIGGPERVIEEISKPLMPFIRTNMPVEKIYQHPDQVEVITQGQSFFADHVIIATSPVVVNKIKFEPPLPESKQNLYANMYMGNIIKCVITYKEPFWYRQNLSGGILSDEGPLECTIDCGFQTKCGALIGYMIGDEAKKWSQHSREQRQEAVLQQLESFLGPEAREPMEYMEINWPQTPWVQGAYYASMAPGAMVAYGEALREPFGQIYWAGTETSETWYGTLEGAVLAGERSANEILR